MNSRPPLYSPRNICELLGISRTTLDRLLRRGFFPMPVRISTRRVVWTVDQLDSWLKSQIAKQNKRNQGQE